MLDSFITTGRTTEDKLFAVLRKSYVRLSPDERLMFLDAAIMLRNCPASHLTAIWEGILLVHDKWRRKTHETAAEWQGRRRTAAAKAAREQLARLVDLSLVTVVKQEYQPFGKRR